MIGLGGFIGEVTFYLAESSGLGSSYVMAAVDVSFADVNISFEPPKKAIAVELLIRSDIPAVETPVVFGPFLAANLYQNALS